MTKTLKDIDLYEVYLKWYEGAGPFECFVRSTNFVSLKHYHDFELKSSEISLQVQDEILKIINLYDIKKTLFFIDLVGENSINIGVALNNEYTIKPILTFNNIIHDFGLIGTKEYISNLILATENMNVNECKGYAFILDNQRYWECDSEIFKHKFNNQYELTEEDLPPLEMLIDLGFEQIVHICENELKEDIGEYLKYLESNNFPVKFEKIR